MAQGADGLQYFGQDRGEMLPFIPLTAKRILEVGCGEGVFGAQLKQRQQAEVWGVEPDPAAAAVASQRLFKAENGFFGESVAAPRKHFDCIVFNDVLEHMVDPWAALKLARGFLRDDQSVIVASLPNFRYWPNMLDVLFGKRFQYVDAGILDRTHLRFFTESSIGDFFAACGYGITTLTGINPTPARKFRLANRLLFGGISDMRYMQFAVVARPSGAA